MNMKEIKEMLQLMVEHDLAEFEVEKDGLKIKLKKMQSGRIVAETYAPMMSAPHSASTASLSAPSLAAKVPAQETSADVITVRSPMVGTFYASPAPDQPPYLTVGGRVKEGDVLCIIEAMKLMNEIKSEWSGEVIELMVKNGQPIEFDQPLCKLKK